MSADKLRIALFGFGKMAKQHVKAIAARSDAELVAVADPAQSAEAVEALAPGAQHFEDAEALLETAKPDVVHIITPPATHEPLARLALEHGAHAYVEKPFTPTAKAAADLVKLARQQGRMLCPGHQVMFQSVAQRLLAELPGIGRVVHVESYFAFRQVRRGISAADQVEDILPHPLYLLLAALGDDDTDIDGLDVDARGEVRALIRAGGRRGVLIVTLQGRPVDSYLRVVGTNGSLEASFILGTLVRLPGPGASAVSVLLNQLSRARQLIGGWFRGVAALPGQRRKGYPGLGELLDRFYGAIRNGDEPPVSPESIERTVGVAEQIMQQLRDAEAEAEAAAKVRVEAASVEMPPPATNRGTLVITGGTGFLGRVTVRELRQRGWPVRVLARREVMWRDREPGVEYRRVELADDIPQDCLTDAACVMHLAAETAGGQPEHERNTVLATRNLLDAAAMAGVKRFINISSLAVLRPGRRGQRLDESSPVDFDNLGRGPYVWAKAEAERMASQWSQGERRAVTVRLGPLVNFENFQPPGRLGRELGRLYVAVGGRRSELSVCDVRTAAHTLRSMVEDFDNAPELLNLVESPAPRRRDLVRRLREARPDLRVIWLPEPLLRMGSAVLKGLQRLARPNVEPLDVHAAFAAERYDTSRAEMAIRRACDEQQTAQGHA